MKGKRKRGKERGRREEGERVGGSANHVSGFSPRVNSLSSEESHSVCQSRLHTVVAPSPETTSLTDASTTPQHDSINCQLHTTLICLACAVDR